MKPRVIEPEENGTENQWLSDFVSGCQDQWLLLINARAIGAPPSSPRNGSEFQSLDLVDQFANFPPNFPFDFANPKKIHPSQKMVGNTGTEILVILSCLEIPK